MSDFQAELRKIFAASPASVAQWERNAFDQLTGAKRDRLVLCGAGGMGRKTLTALRAAGITPLAFADNNSKLAGQSIDGVPVLPASDAVARFGRDAAFVVTIWGAHSRDRLEERKQQWRDRGAETVVSFMSLFWKHAEQLLPHYSCDLPHKVHDQAARIEALASIWSDDHSQREFLAQLKWRTELDFGGLPPPVQGAPYFPADVVRLLPNERFVDCGAYDGDTLADFLRLTDGNFEKLTQFASGRPAAERERIELLPFAASDRPQTLRFAAEASASSAADAKGNIEVEARPLDELFAGEQPTFIKMDIEGGEPAALEGAVSLLQRFRPVVAVCVYHLQEHLWEIPEWLHAHLPASDFYLRAHDLEGWDLVCYAIPHERRLGVGT